MMDRLLHRMSPSGEDKDDPGFRAACGRLSGIAGIAANAVLCLLKLLCGALSGSLSITADAMNNLSDATSSIVTLLGFRLAELPADRNHPYGHARFEYLSGLAVAMIIVLIGFELFQQSLKKIFHPSSIEFSAVIAAVLVGSMAVKLWLSAFNRKLAEKIDSQTIMAASVDSRNDVFSTLAVLVAAAVEHFSGWHVDGPMGLVVALFIIKSGVGMGIETISPLLGEAANPELCRDIAKLIHTCPNVLGFHDLMVHDYGPGQRFASLHVEMPSSMDPLEAHEMIDDLERACLEELRVHLVIHYDPVIVGDAEIDRMKADAERILHNIDQRLSLHDFRMVKGEGHTNLIFDVPLPDDMTGRGEEIKERLENTLTSKKRGRVYCVITFDREGFNPEVQ